MRKTVRRDWLKKQVEAGKVEAKCDMRLTDDYAFDSAYGFGKTDWMPARISKPVFEMVKNYVGNEIDHCVDSDRLDGYVNFRDHHFEGISGYAKRNEDGTIYLHSGGSESYTLRIK